MNIYSGSGIGAVPLLLLAVLGVIVFGAWAGSVAWVWRDAERRGQPGFIVAVLVALLCWPVSLLVWLLVRPQPVGVAPSARPQPWVVALIAVAMVPIVAAAVTVFVWQGERDRLSASAREHQRRQVCRAHMKQLVMAYLRYVNTHEGQCPHALADLRPYGVTDEVLRCPSNANATESSYQLFCGTNAPDVILRDNPINHYAEGGHVAYRDGRVEWIQTGKPAPTTQP
jgi:hypothetical protein